MFHPPIYRLGPCSLFTAAFIVASSTVLGAEATGKKAPVPDAAAQSKAQELLREVYGKEYAGGTGS